jgi:DNA polymerase III epsilon subunit-like protein
VKPFAPQTSLKPNTSLADLAALAVDCQTTGGHAFRDHLIEIGWASVGPGSENSAAPFALLVTLPGGINITPVVTKMTGVQVEDLEAGVCPGEAWSRLHAAARSAPASGQDPVLLIHYARFETPILQRLHLKWGAAGRFPFQIVCTHTIARRLLPHLPRCGLRALAGYFELPLAGLKRAAAHARATRGIWEHLIPLLAAEGIGTWPSLHAWLEKPQSLVRRPKTYPMPREVRLNTPDLPGVYEMRRRNGDLLYIGKARSLKRRINSYFQTRRGHPEHILEMLTQARNLSYVPTLTAVEAAILEADHIKRWAPPYNIALKPHARIPAFCSRDFQTVGGPDRPDLSIGPLPDSRSLQAFGFLVALCAGGPCDLPDEAALSDCLDIPVRYLPPREMLTEAVAAYRERFGRRRDMVRTGRQLLSRGLIVWRRHRAQSPDNNADGDEDPGRAANEAEPEWTPAAVIAWLDGIVRRGSQLVRRGRWLMMLANATLGWTRDGPEAPHERVLSICLGDIHPVASPHGVNGVTESPVANDSRQIRRRIFESAATHDRLRVLTTEIKRLLSEDRQVRLRLAAGGVLENRSLIRLLNLI